MKPNKQAFTLIELLVVVLIIGILAAVALPQYQKVVTKSRYMQLVTMGESIAQAEEVYYLANDTYTNNLEALDIELPEGVNFRIRYGIKNLGAFSVISDELKMGYIVWLNNVGSSKYANRRACRIYEDNTILHKVCQSISPDGPHEGSVLEEGFDYWADYYSDFRE